MGPLAMAGIQTGQQALGGIMGMALAGWNDRRQIKQAKRLQEVEKGMVDYGYQKQLEMWEKTGYVGQREQMEKAGLNPALMYGMGGGGGQTVGNVSGGSGVSSAPKGGGEAMGLMNGMNVAMQAAQIKVLESQANLNNTQANKTSGVDTDEAKKRIEAMTAGISNTEAQTRLTNLMEDWQEMENDVKGDTLQAAKEGIQLMVKKSEQEIQSLINSNSVDGATINEKIEIIKQEARGAALRNALTQAQTRATNQDIKNKIQEILESKQRIDKMAAEIVMMDEQTSYWANQTEIAAANKNISAYDAVTRRISTDFNTNVVREIKNDMVELLKFGVGGAMMGKGGNNNGNGGKVNTPRWKTTTSR